MHCRPDAEEIRISLLYRESGNDGEEAVQRGEQPREAHRGGDGWLVSCELLSAAKCCKLRQGISREQPVLALAGGIGAAEEYVGDADLIEAREKRCAGVWDAE